MQHFPALRVHRNDAGGTQARLESLSLDALTPGEVVVRVLWSSINYKDALAVTGRGRILRRFPCVAGIDLAGIVEHSTAPDLLTGQAVLATGCDLGEALDGGYAAFARLPAAAVVPLPPGLSPREAMTLGTAGFTAALALRRMLENHQSPERGPIAITGASGGVGSLATALFAERGFAVQAITGKAEAHAWLAGLGAEAVLDRRAIDLGSRPLESARWGGAVDNVGGELLTWLTRTTAPWGNIACVGLAASPALETTVMPLILRGVSLLGIHSVACPRNWRLALWDRLAGDWKPADLERRFATREVTLEQVPETCAALLDGRLHGRTLVRIGA
jgi:putative quinone oxidoreductase, YhdH/YhfP family